MGGSGLISIFFPKLLFLEYAHNLIIGKINNVTNKLNFSQINNFNKIN